MNNEDKLRGLIRGLIKEAISEYELGGFNYGDTYDDYRRSHQGEINSSMDDIYRELHTIGQYVEPIKAFVLNNKPADDSRSNMMIYKELSAAVAHNVFAEEVIKEACKYIDDISSLLSNAGFGKDIDDHYTIGPKDFSYIRQSVDGLANLDGLRTIRCLSPIQSAAARLKRFMEEYKQNDASVNEAIDEKHKPTGVIGKRKHYKDENGVKHEVSNVGNFAKYLKKAKPEMAMAYKFQRVKAEQIPDDPNDELYKECVINGLCTTLKDGTKEVEKPHKMQPGDWVLQNANSPERWGVDNKTFMKKYVPDEEHEGIYKPKGAPMLASKSLTRDIEGDASWGHQTVNTGGRILQDPTNPSDSYAIGKDEFGHGNGEDGTYKFADKHLDESKLKNIVRESVKNVLYGMIEESKKKKIHIKKKNEGKFTATKKKTGKSTEELTHSKNPLTKKRAIFAQNAKKWNHGKRKN